MNKKHYQTLNYYGGGEITFGHSSLDEDKNMDYDQLYVGNNKEEDTDMAKVIDEDGKKYTQEDRPLLGENIYKKIFLEEPIKTSEGSLIVCSTPSEPMDWNEMMGGAEPQSGWTQTQDETYASLLDQIMDLKDKIDNYKNDADYYKYQCSELRKSLQLMENDLGTVRRAIGDIEFNRIVEED